MILDNLRKGIEIVNKNYNRNMTLENVLNDISVENRMYTSNETLNDKINELDMLIKFSEYYYSDLLELLMRNELKIWFDDNREFEVRILYLIKLFIEDSIVLKDLAIKNYEHQFITIERNIIEKYKIIVLHLIDYEYSKCVFFNDEHLDEKQMYYKYERPKAVDTRLESYLKNIKEEEQRTGIRTLRFDTHVVSGVIESSLKKIYNISSKYTHCNNVNTIIKNDCKEYGKINMTILGEKKNNLIYFITMLNELLLLNMENVEILLTNRRKHYGLWKYSELLSSYYFGVFVPQNFKLI